MDRCKGFVLLTNTEHLMFVGCLKHSNLDDCPSYKKFIREFDSKETVKVVVGKFLDDGVEGKILFKMNKECLKKVKEWMKETEKLGSWELLTVMNRKGKKYSYVKRIRG